MIDKLNQRIKYTNSIKGMQFVALEILKEFDKICKKNKIEYWISDGTLLGAIRHKGFIPWDDDIDVCVAKEDIKKLKIILEKNLPYYFYLTDEGNDKKMSFYKIRDRYSKASEVENERRQTGIWIDIFPMTSIKESKIINLLIGKFLKIEINSKDKGIKRILKIVVCNIFLKKIIKIKDKTEIRKKYFKKLTNVDELKKNSFIYMEGQEWWHTYKKEWIFPLKEVEFEGFKFLAPNDSEKYLKSYYGKDYMKIPPENKKITHSIEIDLFNSNSHPKSLKWSERKEHIEKYLKELKTNEK